MAGLPGPIGPGGVITTVNGKTGSSVTLDAEDVGAVASVNGDAGPAVTLDADDVGAVAAANGTATGTLTAEEITASGLVTLNGGALFGTTDPIYWNAVSAGQRYITADGSNNFLIGRSGTTTDLTILGTGEAVFADKVYFAAGSASTPAIAPNGDANTGIHFPAADSIAVATGGSNVMFITSAGRIGLQGGTVNGEGRVEVNFSQNDNGVFVNGSNAGYQGWLLRQRATRAASTDFRFWSCEASAGTDSIGYLRGDGNMFLDGTVSTGGADIAVLREWEDGNPEAEDRAGITVVFTPEGKIRPATAEDDPAVIIGAVSRKYAMLLNSSWNKWAGKHLRDPFGAYLWENYEAVTWEEQVETAPAVPESFETFEAPVMEAFEAETFAIVDGRAVLSMVTKTRPIIDEFPVYDAQGNPVLIVTGHDAEGAEIREPRMLRVPRTEIVTRSVAPAQPAQFQTVTVSYALDEIPDGVTVPADAVTTTERRRILNPDYIEGQDYTPRLDRPEWEPIGIADAVVIRTGQPVGDRWVKIRDISETLEEWQVR